MEQQEPVTPKPQRHDPTQCPACGFDKLDSTLMLEGEKRAPTTGDVTVCGECAAVLTFGDGLRLHETPESTLRHALNPEQRVAIANMQNYVRAVAPLKKRIRELERQLFSATIPHGQLYDYLEAWRAWRAKIAAGQRDTHEANVLAQHGHELGRALDALEKRARK